MAHYHKKRAKKDFRKLNIEKEVFENEMFKNHLEQVSNNLEIELDIITDVIEGFIKSSLKLMRGNISNTLKSFNFKYFKIIINRRERPRKPWGNNPQTQTNKL